jgi:hypothetical protein
MKATKKKSQRLNITLSAKMYRAYKSACRRNKASMMAQTRQYIGKFIEENKR